MTIILLSLILLTLLFGRDVTIALLLWAWEVNETIGRIITGLVLFLIIVLLGPLAVAFSFILGSQVDAFWGYVALLFSGYLYARFVYTVIKATRQSQWESLSSSERVAILRAKALRRREDQRNADLWSRKK